MVNELLSSVKLSEEVIKKMKKKSTKSLLDATQSGTSAAAVTDIDKIYIQLYLDVEAFGAQLEQLFGVDKGTFEPYQRLLNTVQLGLEKKNLLQQQQ
jgi:hypothetical protein